MHLNKNIIWKRINNGSMLYNVKSGSKMDLNSTSTQIFLSYFVNRFTAESIAAGISQKVNDIPYETILCDVKECIETISNSNFVTENEEEMSYINLLNPKEVIDNVLLEVTERCNLNCTHCMEGGSKNESEMSLEDIKKVIDQLRMLGVFRLVLTGGEPFMRDDIVEILEKCNNSFMKAIVFTNGLLITDEIINKIKDMNIMIRFSIDGATPETHDKIRGNGSFEKTVDIMKKCVENGIDIAISATINSVNFDQYMDIVKLAESLGVKELELSEVNLFGNAKDNEYLMLSKDQLSKMREYNLKLAYSCESFKRGMGFERQYEQALKRSERKHACNAGVSMCYIKSNGNVYPCILFKNYDEFKAGNVKEEFLFNIWNESSIFKKMRELNINDIPSCNGCDCFDLCPGGCRAKAYMATRDLYGASDEIACSISKEYRAKIVSGEMNYIWMQSKK